MTDKPIKENPMWFGGSRPGVKTICTSFDWSSIRPKDFLEKLKDCATPIQHKYLFGEWKEEETNDRQT